MRLLARWMGSSIVFPLACFVGAVMIFISELSYWQSVRALHAPDGMADVLHTLMLRRVGIALLTVVSVIALLVYVRQIASLKREQLRLKAVLQAERDRLEIEVAQRTAELTQLAKHLQTAREDERARLARDLHDELGALLTSAKLDAARIRLRLAGKAPEALERLAHLVATLNSGIALKRRIIEDLHPSALANLGLAEALTILGREFSERSGVRVNLDLQSVALSPAVDLVAYRVVQEAITNISKHAQARHVWITLVPLQGRASLRVRDDGVGFDGTPPPGSAHGLIGMRFRVEAAGGEMRVSSQPGQGTEIEVLLPTAPCPTTAR